MGKILSNWRITLAAVFAIILVGGSFLLARDIDSPTSAQASAESALLQAIAAKDSDSDGLADWEEALYGTNPQIIDSFNLGMADGDAVNKGLIVPKSIANIAEVPQSASALDASGLPAPAEEGTLTAGFSEKFFGLYLSAKEANGGQNLSAEETSRIANAAMEDLFSSVTAQPDYKSLKDLTVSGSGADALKTFAADAQTVIIKNAAKESMDEIAYLNIAVEEESDEALTHLVAIAKANRDTAVGLSALTVPAEIAPDALFLINSFMRLGEIINDFSRVNSDPLTTMLALGQYLKATQNLWQAFENIGTTYTKSGVTIELNAPGAVFVNLAAIITAQKSATSKP